MRVSHVALTLALTSVVLLAGLTACSKGPQGDAGPSGPQGPKGDAGPIGSAGLLVLQVCRVKKGRQVRPAQASG